jgi:transposase-like protein
MNKTIAAPTSLVTAIRYFSNPDVALDFLAGLRWPDGVACPICGSKENSFLKTRRIWKCKGCRKQFSVKLGTIFEDSPIGLDKWLPAIWLLVNAKNGISSYELARGLGVTQKTAWFMLHRIRLAMQTKTFNKFKGDVEVDESFIGGLARFMHKGPRKTANQRAPVPSKTAVMGLLERHGNDPLDKGSSTVRVRVVRTTRRHDLWAEVHEHVEPGSEVFTDAHPSYRGLEERYIHKVIDHAECYAKGKVHTNGLENFWSLLKRGIKGTYVNVEPFHLFRYLDEQVFRFNNRKTKDVARFVSAVGQIIGKRLTYANLIGAGLVPVPVAP